jgi:hypothetical protein
MMRFVMILAGALLLAACGSRAPLTPPESASLPQAPHGATAPPNADELLRRDALAAPERSVELRRRSEERQDDPFDLPPE